MAKGPIVTPEVEAFIASVYKNHPKWKAKVVQREVSYRLRKDNPKLPPGWPSLSTVQKVLAKARKSQPLDPQGEDWSVASIEHYPIDREALPSVLELCRFRQEKWGNRLTIREAKWASRLSLALPDIETLSFVSFFYAYGERIYQLAGDVFLDSTGVDLSLFGGQPILTPETPDEVTAVVRIAIEAYKKYVTGGKK
jgi:hypothetical protein